MYNNKKNVIVMTIIYNSIQRYNNKLLLILYKMMKILELSISIFQINRKTSAIVSLFAKQSPARKEGRSSACRERYPNFMKSQFHTLNNSDKRNELVDTFEFRSSNYLLFTSTMQAMAASCEMKSTKPKPKKIFPLRG